MQDFLISSGMYPTKSDTACESICHLSLTPSECLFPDLEHCDVHKLLITLCSSLNRGSLFCEGLEALPLLSCEHGRATLPRVSESHWGDKALSDVEEKCLFSLFCIARNKLLIRFLPNCHGVWGSPWLELIACIIIGYILWLRCPPVNNYSALASPWPRIKMWLPSSFLGYNLWFYML